MRKARGGRKATWGDVSIELGWGGGEGGVLFTAGLTVAGSSDGVWLARCLINCKQSRRKKYTWEML